MKWALGNWWIETSSNKVPANMKRNIAAVELKEHFFMQNMKEQDIMWKARVKLAEGKTARTH